MTRLVINDGLGRGGDGAPVADPGLSAEAFVDYFDRKVADIRSATDGAPLPVFRDISTSDCASYHRRCLHVGEKQCWE